MVIPAHNGVLYSLDISPDGTVVATAGEDKVRICVLRLLWRAGGGVGGVFGEW